MTKTTAAVLVAAVFAAVLGGCGPSVDAQINQGVSQFQVGELDKAKETLTRVLAGEPSNPKALFYMGRVFYAQGAYEQATYYFQCTLDADPAYPQARKLLKDSQDRAGAVGPALRIIPEPAKNVVHPDRTEAATEEAPDEE